MVLEEVRIQIETLGGEAVHRFSRDDRIKSAGLLRRRSNLLRAHLQLAHLEETSTLLVRRSVAHQRLQALKRALKWVLQVKVV